MQHELLIQKSILSPLMPHLADEGGFIPTLTLPQKRKNVITMTILSLERLPDTTAFSKWEL